MADRSRPALWKISNSHQGYTTSLIESVMGKGPAVNVTSYVPDLHYFNGRGGKDAMPLYRDANASEPNITQGLLALLTECYGSIVTPEDLAGYIAGVLGHPGYTEKFHDELEVPGPRVPLTKDAALFRHATNLGKQVIAWQTYAERFPESIGTTQGNVPRGNASLTTAIPDDPDGYPQSLKDVAYNECKRELYVGDGIISQVDPRIWAYEVSGLRVVRSWLGYRVKNRSGKKSSPLDDIRPERWTFEMTQELMALLWVLEGVIALEPAQAELLDEIVAGKLFLATELPTPTDAERMPPKVENVQQMGLEI
ncbi:MAG: type ISP restriction/modification enzyme [Thermomicrobiales bacterium]